MLSTNSRAFQDKVKLWILTHADFADYDLHPNKAISIEYEKEMKKQ